MSNAKLRSYLPGTLAVILVILNFIPFRSQQVAYCSNNEHAYIITKTRLGFPAPYLTIRHVEYDCLTGGKLPTEQQADNTFLLQAAIVNLVVIGGIYMLTRIAVETTKGSKT